MKIDANGKIIEITESELFTRYLDLEMEDCMDFNEYIWRMEHAGCTVVRNCKK